jgi:hypothetical protein
MYSKGISDVQMLQKPGAIALVLLLAGTVGWSIPVIVGQDVGTSDLWLLWIVIVTPALLVTAIRPVFGGIAVLSFAFINPEMLPPLSELGEFSIRLFDLAFAGLVFMACVMLPICQAAGN